MKGYGTSSAIYNTRGGLTAGSPGAFMFRCQSERAGRQQHPDQRNGGKHMVHDARSASPFRLIALVGEPQFRKDDAVQRADRIAPEGGQLPGRHRRTERGAAPDDGWTECDASRSPRDVPHAGSPDEQIATEVLLGTARHTPSRHRCLRRRREPPREEPLPCQPDHRPPDTDGHRTEHG